MNPISSFRLAPLVWFCATAAIVIGGLVLVGWVADIAVLKSVFPGLVTMKVNTAIGLVLGGVALTLRSRHRDSKQIHVGVAVPALALMLLGALSLGEDVLGRDFGIDQWLVRDVRGAVESSSPGRMSPSTAFCFVLVGSALLVKSLPVPSRLQRIVLAALGAVETTPDGIVIVDRESRIAFANPAASATLGIVAAVSDITGRQPNRYARLTLP